MFIEDNYILISSSRLSFASFLWSPTRSKKKKRSHANFRFAWLLLLFSRLFLHFRYSVYSFVGMSVKKPRVVESIARKIYFIIGQSAVNASTHNQPTICRTFCRASSLLSATTSNTPSKTYCVRTLKTFFFIILKFNL